MRALGLVVPLYNEVSLCGASVRALVACLDGVGAPYQLLLVDNGSTDGTWGLLQELCRSSPSVRMLRLSHNEGYGGGILSGLAQLDTPLLGWHWGDAQIEPGVVVQAWRVLEAEHLDMVKTRRIHREDGKQRALISTLYHAFAAHFSRVKTSDINGCPKILTRESWARIHASHQGWLLDFQVMTRAESLRLKVGEVQATMRAREGGSSHVRLHTLGEFVTNMGRVAADARRDADQSS